MNLLLDTKKFKGKDFRLASGLFCSFAEITAENNSKICTNILSEKQI